MYNCSLYFVRKNEHQKCFWIIDKLYLIQFKSLLSFSFLPILHTMIVGIRCTVRFIGYDFYRGKKKNTGLKSYTFTHSTRLCKGEKTLLVLLHSQYLTDYFNLTISDIFFLYTQNILWSCQKKKKIINNDNCLNN